MESIVKNSNDTKNKLSSNDNNIGNKLEDFDILQILDEDNYSYETKVKSKLNSKLYELSKIISGNLNEKEKINKKKELILLKKLNHPNIFELLSHFEDNGNDYYISNFFKDSNLFTFLEANAKLNVRIKEEILWDIFLQCLEGLTYLHNQGIIHRDIKPSNILIDENRKIKIGEFGIAAVMEENQAKIFTDDPQMQKALILIPREKAGTLNYMAPEVENMEIYDQKVDVYSLGISFYAICFYNLPYLLGNNMNEMENDNIYSDELKNNILRMIQRDKNQRPTSSEIYNQFRNDYFQKYGKNP